MLKKLLLTAAFSTVALLGLAQLASEVRADPPTNPCIGILCIQCPPGYVLSPTPGNCCRCVKAH